MGRRDRRKLGSRTYKNYSIEMLNTAVDLVKRKEITSLEAEKRFFIPRRTIENKVKGLHMHSPGAPLRLTESEEKDIVKVLIAASEFGSPLSRLDLRILIFEYLKKNGKSYLFDNKVPGKWWANNFLHRHKDSLTIRSVQNIKRSRAEKTAEELQRYFSNLEISLKDVQSTNIVNYDETNFSDSPGSLQCIFKRNVKYPERILNSSKGNISIMFAASADGTLLPVYTVYKSEYLWSTWAANGPEDARYNRTKSGWFDSKVFEDWFKSVVIPWAKKLEGPKVVIGDNLSSHLNVNILNLCEQHNIRFVFLPPNSTHITQPLDVAYFGPLKKHWRRILTEYKIENPSETSINKSHFPILLKQLLDSINIVSKENIRAGFKATGIVPFNPQKVLIKIPEYEEDIKYSIDTTLLDYLKQTKSPQPLQKITNRKLKVEPGVSISSQDLESLLAEKQTGTPKTKKKNAKLIKVTTDENLSSEIGNKQKQVKAVSQKKVVILSDVRNIPENKKYLDLSQFGPLQLTEVDSNFDIYAAKPCNISDDICANPVASTSGINKERKPEKRESSHKHFSMVKKRKVQFIESDDDESSVDKYSLRDTSDEIDELDDENNDLDIIIHSLEKEKTKEQHDIRTLEIKSFEEDFNSILNNLDSLEAAQNVMPDLDNAADRHEYNNIINIKTNQRETTIVRMDENVANNESESLCSCEKLNDIILEKTIKDGKKCDKELSQSEENNFEKQENIGLNQSVLVRYYNRKKWKYYVGHVEDINFEEGETYYTINFLRTINRRSVNNQQENDNRNLKFIVAKRIDRDSVPFNSIVKAIELSTTDKPNEYVLQNDSDAIYF